ncbi:hypothetical protein [Dactylosporangium salmoneum]|uniref:Uncharacterized protein n=1 Tax=Dactylosporangium salmoneum TaxID=53361 RepID=A0ABN3GA22_9ACTN
MTRRAVVVAPARIRCRSKSPFGDCGLSVHHGGDLHAVPIGDDFWFAYEGGGRRATRVGYGTFHGGEWCAAPCYCNEESA